MLYLLAGSIQVAEVSGLGKALQLGNRKSVCFYCLPALAGTWNSN